MMVLKGIDWQMVGFVGVSLLQEYVTLKNLPRVYYWDQQNQDDDDNDDENNKIA
jgi:hypothetical protein